MGWFSRRARKPGVQRLGPVELALSLTAITGRGFDGALKSARELSFTVLPLELFAVGVFATAWNASRHALVTGLTRAQGRVVMDAYAVLAYCLWINGREGLSKRLPGRLDWADFVRFKQTVDWRQYGVLQRSSANAPQSTALSPRPPPREPNEARWRSSSGMPSPVTSSATAPRSGRWSRSGALGSFGR